MWFCALCYVQLTASGIQRGARPFDIMPHPGHDWVEIARVHGWATALEALGKLEREQIPCSSSSRTRVDPMFMQQ